MLVVSCFIASCCWFSLKRNKEKVLKDQQMFSAEAKSVLSETTKSEVVNKSWDIGWSVSQ